MGPKLAPRNQVYIPNKPANEAGSPVVIRVSEDRQWLSEYQRIASGYQSISHQANYRYPMLDWYLELQPAPGILQSRQHCRLCRLQSCSHVGAGRRAGIPPRPTQLEPNYIANTLDADYPQLSVNVSISCSCSLNMR